VLTLLNSLDFNPPPNQFSDFHNPAWSIYQVRDRVRVGVRVRVRVRVRVGVRVLG